MKTSKRISAIIMALAMVLSLCVNVFATGMSAPTKDEFTITITPTDDVVHTYEAYQIFKGYLTEEGGKHLLTDIDWGSGIQLGKGKDIVAALKTKEVEGKHPFESLNDEATAADVADLLRKEASEDIDDPVTRAFADVISEYLTTTTNDIYTSTKDSSGVYKIENVPAGYYLIKDKNDLISDTEDGAYTRYIMRVVEDVNATSKSEVPSVTKKILEDGNKVDENTAGIGEVVHYVLTSKVPDTTDYNKYFFIFHDKMSAGLTFGNDVKVTLYKLDADGNRDSDTAAYPYPDGKVDVTTPSEPVLSGDYVGGTNIKIVLEDFLTESKNHFGWEIEVTYTATVNDKAKINDEANPNDVYLQFSNDPNYEYEGDNEPTGNDPYGETPNSTVKTFTTQLQINKKDDEGNKLSGAEFQIKGKTISAPLVTGYEFVELNPGEHVDEVYYKLKDGTYTTTAPAPDGSNDENYESPTKTYKKVTYNKTGVTSTDDTTIKAFVDENGVLKVTGLKAGTYIIKEIDAPEGYNLLKKAIAVQFKVSYDARGNATWTYAEIKDIDPNTEPNNADLQKEFEALTTDKWKPLTGGSAFADVTVINKKGIQLPETGGVGTTIFYILGGGLLIAALAILVSKILSSSKTKSAKAVRATENI